MSLIKRDKHDALFSDLVRERANWTCERCGRQFPPGHRQGLHCSHFFGRAKKGTRWHPDNGTALCHGCHSYFTAHPYEHTCWQVERLGQGLVDILREKANAITRLRKADMDSLLHHLKEELKAMQMKRAQGETGRIEFEAWG